MSPFFCPSVHSALDDLFDVQSELITVAANWKNIGIALRLRPDLLERTETRYCSDPLRCLSVIVKEWLIRNYNVERFGEPTWQRLVEAVGHPAGGANMALARDIARRYRAVGMWFWFNLPFQCLSSCTYSQ